MASGSVTVLAGLPDTAVRSGVCNLPGLKFNTVCTVPTQVGDVVGGIASGAIRELSDAVVGAVNEVLGAVLGFLAAPVSPDVQQHWLSASFDRMLQVSATFAALFFLFGIARAALRSSTRELGRVVGYTIAAFAGTGVALSLTQAFIVLVDVATSQIAAGTPRDIAETFKALANPLVRLAAGSNGQALLAALLGMFVGLAALAVYLELFVRNVMIHVVVYFLPLMLIGTIWGPTRSWGKRGIEFLAVLILSKFVLFAVIALGWSAVASFDAASIGASWGSVLTGFVLIAVAAWLPWLLFKLLPFMEVHVRSAMNRHDARAGMTAPMTSAGAPLRTLESNLRRAASVAALVKGGPLAAAAVSGGGRGGGGSAGSGSVGGSLGSRPNSQSLPTGGAGSSGGSGGTGSSSGSGSAGGSGGSGGSGAGNAAGRRLESAQPQPATQQPQQQQSTPPPRTPPQGPSQNPGGEQR